MITVLRLTLRHLFLVEQKPIQVVGGSGEFSDEFSDEFA